MLGDAAFGWAWASAGAFVRLYPGVNYLIGKIDLIDEHINLSDMFAVLWAGP
jgi:hypothetical protein